MNCTVLFGVANYMRKLSCLQSFDVAYLLLQLCNPFSRIEDCHALFLIGRILHVLIILHKEASDLQIILLNDLFTGRNLSLEACNLRQLLGLICCLPACI